MKPHFTADVMERLAQMLVKAGSSEQPVSNNDLYAAASALLQAAETERERTVKDQSRLARAISYAEEGRASHLSWETYLAHCETCDQCKQSASYPGDERLKGEIGTLAEQREWVSKYDEILACLREGLPLPPAPGKDGTP